MYKCECDMSQERVNRKGRVEVTWYSSGKARVLPREECEQRCGKSK